MQVRPCARGGTTRGGESLLPGTLRALGYPEPCVHVYCPSFSPRFSSPPTQGLLSCPTVLRLINLSVPVSHMWLAGSELCSFLWADTEESCQLYFFFPSLFVSILFQLNVDFILLAGKRRLPSPIFFKLNLFFYLRISIKVM